MTEKDLERRRRAAPIEGKQPIPDFMGTLEDAKRDLMEKTRAWRAFRQPLMAVAAIHKKREAQEREAQFQLANAALHWLWHAELADTPEPKKDDPLS